jgi:hypothetical protein
VFLGGVDLPALRQADSGSYLAYLLGARVTRQAVIDAAIRNLGKPNSAEFWVSALGHRTVAQNLAWCGIFDLFCLHEGGLALDVHWAFGLGFLYKLKLPLTKTPQLADIGYRDQPFQHHFLVEAVDGPMVHSIDGNSGAHSTVNRCTHPNGSGCIYYSIASLVGEVELPSPSQSPPASGHRPSEIQHAINNLIVRYPLNNPPQLLTVDGILGPKSRAAIAWAQTVDPAACAALGLS